MKRPVVGPCQSKDKQAAPTCPEVITRPLFLSTIAIAAPKLDQRCQRRQGGEEPSQPKRNTRGGGDRRESTERLKLITKIVKHSLRRNNAMSNGSANMENLWCHKITACINSAKTSLTREINQYVPAVIRG